MLTGLICLTVQIHTMVHINLGTEERCEAVSRLFFNMMKDETTIVATHLFGWFKSKDGWYLEVPDDMMNCEYEIKLNSNLKTYLDELGTAIGDYYSDTDKQRIAELLKTGKIQIKDCIV